MRKAMMAVAFAAAAVGVGCSGNSAYAPVSGIVTVDGKPYGKAVVTLQPFGTKENPNPGRGSSAYTDENGKFVLNTDDGHGGAVVGKHRVRIMSRGNDVVGFDPATGSPDGDVAAPAKPGSANVDPIGPEWNANSEKEFDVPAGGTDKANFDIISVKAKKK